MSTINELLRVLGDYFPVADLKPHQQYDLEVRMGDVLSNIDQSEIRELRKDRVRQRNSELAEKIVAREPAEDFTYNAPPPLLTIYVDAVFERGGEILPVPFDLEED